MIASGGLAAPVESYYALVAPTMEVARWMVEPSIDLRNEIVERLRLDALAAAIQSARLGKYEPETVRVPVPPMQLPAFTGIRGGIRFIPPGAGELTTGIWRPAKRRRIRGWVMRTRERAARRLAGSSWPEDDGEW